MSLPETVLVLLPLLVGRLPVQLKEQQALFKANLAQVNSQLAQARAALQATQAQLRDTLEQLDVERLRYEDARDDLQRVRDEREDQVSGVKRGGLAEA